MLKMTQSRVYTPDELFRQQELVIDEILIVYMVETVKKNVPAIFTSKDTNRI